MVKITFFALIILCVVCLMLFATTTLTNGGQVYKAFATHPDVPPSGSLLLWAKTDNTFQTTNSGGTDAGMGGGSAGPSLFRPPVPVDNTTGWTDYGSTTGRTIDTSNTGIVILTSAVGAAVANIQGRKMAVTAPFSKIFVILPFVSQLYNAYGHAGVFVGDSAGKVSLCAIEATDPAQVFFQAFNADGPTLLTRGVAGAKGSVTLPAPMGVVSSNTILAPFNDLTTNRSFALSGLSTLSYFKLDDTASTLRCQWSPDGYSWQTVWTSADTAFLTAPTTVGYYVSAFTSSKTTLIVRGVE